MARTTALAPSEPISLDVGLDFSSPKATAPRGSLSECYNHEVTDILGMKRIDGYTRFDGRYSPSYAQDGTVVQLTTEHEFVTPIEVGDILLFTQTDTKEVRFGKILWIDVDGSITDIYVVRFSNAQITSATLEVERTSETFVTDIRVGAPVDTTIVDPNASDNVSKSNEVYDGIRANITKFPNGRRAHGLHWFKDRLYAVVDDLYVPFEDGAEEIFAGDTVEWATAGYTALVRQVVLTAGTWAGNDAEGYLVVQAVVDVVAASPYEATYQNSWASQSLTINRPTPVASAAVVLASTALPTDISVIESASLWRCDNEEVIDQDGQEPDNVNLGWNPVDMGWELGFEDGSYFERNFQTLNRNNANNPDDFEGIIVALDNTGDSAGPQAGEVFNQNPLFTSPDGVQFVLTGSAPNTITNLATPNFYDAQDTDSLIISTQAPTTTTAQRFRFAQPFTFSNFNDYSTIPAGSSIVGIEVQVRAWQTIGGSDTLPADEPTAFVARPRIITESGESVGESRFTELDRTGTSTANAVVVTMGGAVDMFGLGENIKIEDITATNFLVDFAFFTVPQDGGLVIDRTISIDFIKVVLHYRTPDTKVYFWNEVDDVSANLVASWVSSGDLTLSNADGRFHVYRVETVGAGARSTFNVGDEIRSAPGGAGKLLGIVADFVKGGQLASLSQILEVQGRYLAITANFYAREDWDAFYGVNGVTRGYVFDGLFFRHIYTGLVDEYDTPRHVAYHLGHLMLGYPSGVVQISAPGSPEDFFTPGAFQEIGVGDRVTGLVRMNGVTTGVLCESSVVAIDGTLGSGFTTKILSPDEGAIEYTAADIGKPVWCSYNGVSTFDQTASYGDFLGVRLSSVVHPWLLGRLRKDKGFYGLRGADSVVCAIPVPDKNQYRIFFADGYILTMTLVGQEGRPVFTMQQYYISGEREVKPPLNPLDLPILVPVAHSSVVDSNGEVRVHVSHYSRFYSDTNILDSLKYVFELDKGWSFDTTPIVADFTTNHSFTNSPYEIAVTRKVMLFGQSMGFAELRVDMASNFRDPDDQTVNISIPLNAELDFPDDSDTELVYDMKPYYAMANVAKRGLTTAYRIASWGPENSSAGLRVQPPYVCQALLLQTADGKEEV